MNELVQIHDPRPLDAYRMSTDAAGACAAIVKKTAVSISGRRHVTVEGWQAIAIAHGCAASSDHVERVTDEGMSGFKAIGFVRRMSDGAEIARAEGFLGDDEAMWTKRTVHARRAMVQTRAISRACRSAFAHVVVMIDGGLSTTPAEEMGFDRETGEIIEAREKVPGIHKIKERLSKLRKDGDAATTLDAFNALIKERKDDLKTIRDANHEWWTGDGEDFEGYAAWKDRRKAELSEQPSETYKMCLETMEACTSKQELDAWFKLNWKYVEELDGAERDRLEARYDELDTAFKAVAVASV